MFNGKSFNEKFLLARKYYDFARAINCTGKLTCVCAYACACDRTRLRKQYAEIFRFLYFRHPLFFSLSAIALEVNRRQILKFMTSSTVEMRT